MDLKLKENAKIYNEFEKGLESCCSVINTAISKGNFGSGFVKSFTSGNFGEVNYNFEDSYAYIYGDLDFVFDETKIKTMITPIVKIIKENTNTNGDK